MSLRTMLDRWVPGKSAEITGLWEQPGALDEGQVGRPQIAMDEQGNALAAWHHKGEDREGIYICRYHSDQRGWDVMPRRLDTSGTQAQAPEIAMNYRSELAVVWHEREAGQVRVCARHMLGSEDTWVPYPVILQVAPGEVSSLHTGMDLQGNIHAVWCRGDASGTYQVFVTRFDSVDRTWEPEPIALGLAGPAPLFPQLAVNAAGQGLVIWSTKRAQEEGGLVACHYDPGARAWSDRPIPVAAGSVDHLRMDMDARGNAVVLWVQVGPGGIKWLQASHLNGQTVEWTTAPMLASGPSLFWPQVGLDQQRRAHAVWRQETAGVVKLCAKRFVDGRWDAKPTLLAEDVGDSQAHALSVNAQGHALVIWLQNQDAKTMVFVRRFNGKAWSPHPVLLSASGRTAFQDPGVVMSPGGRFAVIWRQGNASRGSIFSAIGQA